MKRVFKIIIDVFEEGCVLSRHPLFTKLNKDQLISLKIHNEEMLKAVKKEIKLKENNEGLFLKKKAHEKKL